MISLIFFFFSINLLHALGLHSCFLEQKKVFVNCSQNSFDQELLTKRVFFTLFGKKKIRQLYEEDQKKHKILLKKSFEEEMLLEKDPDFLSPLLPSQDAENPIKNYMKTLNCYYELYTNKAILEDIQKKIQQTQNAQNLTQEIIKTFDRYKATYLKMLENKKKESFFINVALQDAAIIFVLLGIKPLAPVDFPPDKIIPFENSLRSINPNIAFIKKKTKTMMAITYIYDKRWLKEILTNNDLYIYNKKNKTMSIQKTFEEFAATQLNANKSFTDLSLGILSGFPIQDIYYYASYKDDNKESIQLDETQSLCLCLSPFYQNAAILNYLYGSSFLDSHFKWISYNLKNDCAVETEETFRLYSQIMLSLKDDIEEIHQKEDLRFHGRLSFYFYSQCISQNSYFLLKKLENCETVFITLCKDIIDHSLDCLIKILSGRKDQETENLLPHHSFDYSVFKKIFHDKKNKTYIMENLSYFKKSFCDSERKYSTDPLKLLNFIHFVETAFVLKNKDSLKKMLHQSLSFINKDEKMHPLNAVVCKDLRKIINQLSKVSIKKKLDLYSLYKAFIHTIHYPFAKINIDQNDGDIEFIKNLEKKFNIVFRERQSA